MKGPCIAKTTKNWETLTPHTSHRVSAPNINNNMMNYHRKHLMVCMDFVRCHVKVIYCMHYELLSGLLCLKVWMEKKCFKTVHKLTIKPT